MGLVAGWPRSRLGVNGHLFECLSLKPHLKYYVSNILNIRLFRLYLLS